MTTVLNWSVTVGSTNSDYVTLGWTCHVGREGTRGGYRAWARKGDERISTRLYFGKGAKGRAQRELMMAINQKEMIGERSERSG
jgi:hypothetical protein